MTLQVAINSQMIRSFCQRWKVRELSVFGSAVREDFRPDSDIDVLISFADDAPWSLLELAEMQEELTAILGRNVDLVEKEAIRNPFRRSRILGEREVIYAA